MGIGGSFPKSILLAHASYGPFRQVLAGQSGRGTWLKPSPGAGIEIRVYRADLLKKVQHKGAEFALPMAGQVGV